MNRYQSIETFKIGATSVKLNLCKYFKIYWGKKHFHKVLFVYLFVEIQYLLLHCLKNKYSFSSTF